MAMIQYGSRLRWRSVAGFVAGSALFMAIPGAAQDVQPVSVPAAATYADIAGLLETAPVVVKVEVRSQATLEPERQTGVRPGHVRLYLQARTESLLVGRAAVGESLAFLADVPLDARGKVPKLKKQRFIIFALPVPGRRGELQLAGPDAMMPADPALEQQVRTIATELTAPDAAPQITGVRDVMSVRGNLAGESETQMFLDTVSGAPVSLTVIRRPGMEPNWGVSWTEIVDQSASPPQAGTLEWYRLACSLPRRLPADAFLQTASASRFQAEADYEFVLQQLGPCERRND